MKYILGIDIGTTAIKAAVIGEDGEIYGTKTSEYPLTTLPSGEVEADLSLYEEAFKQSIKESVKNARVPVKDIKCIGFSSTAETCVFLDENNKPLCKVIAWMDTRATKEAKELTEQFEKQDIIKKVGFDGIYAIHPVSKILAVKHKTPEIFEKTRMFAQIKDYFIFKLTGTYYTDHSTASDHGFFDITNRCYWKEMLAYTGIKEEYLPKLEEPGTELGMISESAKLKLAFILDKHDTIGIDCVAMCVNDIACAGGEPLFFLDYIACGKNEPEKIAKIVSGVADGCRQADSALIGGETAEMPGFYPIDEYDLAGFSVGIVDKKDMITGKDLKAGDVLVGMASSGIHSNGYSLVRSVFSMKEETLNQKYESLESDLTLGETLLTPTKIYVKALRQIKEAGVRIKACSHITGGGFYENIPRMLKEGTHAKIKKDSFVIPPIFKMLASDGSIAEEAMFNTYNMGVGMITAVDKQDVDKTVEAIKAAGETPYIMGEIVDGEKGITLC